MADSLTALGAAAQRAEQSSISVGNAGAMAQTLVWLLVVIGVILALAWLVRRFTNIGPYGNGAMRLISALPLGNRERIVLVQVGDKQLLLGVAPGNVTTLHVFDEPVVGSTPVNSKLFDSSTPFNRLLRNALNKEQR
jgi:flagellar protein FliO/FliZ